MEQVLYLPVSSLLPRALCVSKMCAEGTQNMLEML